LHIGLFWEKVREVYYDDDDGDADAVDHFRILDAELEAQRVTSQLCQRRMSSE